MKFSLRLIFPLILVLILMAYVSGPLIDQVAFKWFSRDVETRAKLIADTLHDSLLTIELLKDPRTQTSQIRNLFEHATEDEKVLAIGYCDPQNKLIQKTSLFPEDITCPSKESLREPYSEVFKNPPRHIYFQRQQELNTSLILIHDLSFIQARHHCETRVEPTCEELEIIFACRPNPQTPFSPSDFPGAHAHRQGFATIDP